MSPSRMITQACRAWRRLAAGDAAEHGGRRRARARGGGEGGRRAGLGRRSKQPARLPPAADEGTRVPYGAWVDTGSPLAYCHRRGVHALALAGGGGGGVGLLLSGSEEPGGGAQGGRRGGLVQDTSTPRRSWWRRGGSLARPGAAQRRRGRPRRSQGHRTASSRRGGQGQGWGRWCVRDVSSREPALAAPRCGLSRARA